MAKMKVWNDNIHDYRETFKGDPIHIKAKGYVIMDADDAVMFRGTFAPPVLGVDKQHMAQGFKMIRLEPFSGEDAAPVAKEEGFTCIACKYKASSQTDLDEHAKAMHAAQLVKDEEAEEVLRRKAMPKAG